MSKHEPDCPYNYGHNCSCNPQAETAASDPLDTLVRDIIKVPYSKHYAKERIRQWISDGIGPDVETNQYSPTGHLENQTRQEIRNNLGLSK